MQITHITVHCPSCQEQYRLDPGLRGQRMRCPNPICRTIFEVREDGELGPIREEELPPSPSKPEPPAPKAPPSANVVESLPILEAEVVVPGPTKVDGPVPKLEPAQKEKEPTSPAPKPASSWQQPPPVRRPTKLDRAVPPSPESQEEAPKRERLVEPVMKPFVPESADWKSKPPERRVIEEVKPPEAPPPYPLATELSTATLLSPPIVDVEEPPPSAGRRALWLMAVMVILTGGIMAVVGVVFFVRMSHAERNLYEHALTEFKEGHYDRAMHDFEDLEQNFPSSDKKLTYELLLAWSRLHNQILTLQTDPRTSLDELRAFLHEHKEDPLLKERPNEAKQLLRALTKQLANQASESVDPQVLDLARTALSESQRYSSKQADEEYLELYKEITRVEDRISRGQRRQQLLALLKQWSLEPTNDRIRQGRILATREGFDKDAAVEDLLRKMEVTVQKAVRYVEWARSSEKPSREHIEPSVLVLPRVGLLTKLPPEGSKVTPALVRGVLYALDQDTGLAHWAIRVGVDTTSVPIRLPATPTTPALFLVLSADRNTVMALTAQDGRLYWQYRLDSPCLGRPVVVDRRAFLGTYDGRVHEIEIAGGNLIGYFELGQPLTVGGVWQEGTDKLYFPGDSENIYVLEIARGLSPQQGAKKKLCSAILRTGHPSGSLRSEPILVNQVDAVTGRTNPGAGYLILNQADGLNHMRLRVFALPVDKQNAAPLLNPEPRISGWSWFQPFYDREKLAFVTDMGMFGIFGIKQTGNEDEPLFRLLSEEKSLSESAGRLGRGQVVHAIEDDFWVIAAGALRRLHFDPFHQTLIPRWESSIQLGSPVHAADMDEATRTLYLVTHDLDRHIYLASAVDAETGTILWQRQLGVEAHGDPVVLGERVLMLDRSGAVFGFEAGKENLNPREAWHIHDKVLAGPLQEGAANAVLLPDFDGKNLIEIAGSSKSRRVSFRVIPAQLNPGQDLKTMTVELPAPLMGVPGIGPDCIILPLADGSLQRLALPLNGKAGTNGPNWRMPGADEDALGYVVHLGKDEFLVTDGSRSITHWKWDGDVYERVPPNPDLATKAMPARIVAAPVLLPRNKLTDPFQVCIADAEGSVSVFGGPDLKHQGSCSVGGRITAGPFLRGAYLGCVVEGKKLVWIEPQTQSILWQTTLPGQGIVGQPQVMQELVVVADESGQLFGLNAATGRPLGTYLLRTSAAPSSAPVAFGKVSALVPLSDGTLFQLSLSVLSSPLNAVPLGF